MLKLPSLAMVAVGLTLLVSAAGAEPAGNKPFCLQKGTSGALECAYDTMAQCKKAATGATDSCTPNKDKGGKAAPPPK